MEGPPVPFLGFDPTDDPGRLPVSFDTGGPTVGGGLVLRPIRGISIAFGQPFGTELPLWQNLEDLGPRA